MDGGEKEEDSEEEDGGGGWTNGDGGASHHLLLHLSEVCEIERGKNEKEMRSGIYMKEENQLYVACNGNLTHHTR